MRVPQNKFAIFYIFADNICMIRIIKNLIHGVGSVLEVWPESNHRYYYVKLHPTPDHALHQDFENVGRDMWNAWHNVVHIEVEEK